MIPTRLLDPKQYSQSMTGPQWFQMRVVTEYAGVGSRETPPWVCEAMSLMAAVLEYYGYTMRSGGAPGADDAFEKGVVDPRNKKIYAPWPGFEGRPLRYPIPRAAFGITAPFHPVWDNLSQGMQRMMARNAMQVLGESLTMPADFVLCWTPDGAQHHSRRSQRTGGTGQAISIASHYGVPVYNLATYDWYIQLRRDIGLDFEEVHKFILNKGRS